MNKNISGVPIKPKHLAAGQTIGLVAPASPPNEPDEVRWAIEVIESLGFRVKLPEHLFDRCCYFAGEDAQRATDLTNLFSNDQVDAIFCVFGGYGSSRILPLLDYDVIRTNPKVLIGYSDITALLLAIYAKTGLIVFHGPLAGQTYTAYTLSELKKVLYTPQAPLVIGAPPHFERGEGCVEKNNRITTLVPGKARGRLIGGNLTLIAHLIGTPYMPDLSGSILFLEEVGEEVYSIDRMLTQLWLSGNLQKVAGVVFGRFANLSQSRWAQNRLKEDVLAERVRSLNIPSIVGLMIGHIEDQTTIPIGCLAELDANIGKLTLLEEPVLSSVG